MRLLRLSTAALALALSSHAISQQRDEGEVVFVRTTDPDMVAAIKSARAALDDFLKLAAEPPAGTDDYKLKVMIFEGTATEHFWVTPFKTLPNGFAGVLANDPKVVKSVKVGEIIRFDRSQISDWGYVRNGRQIGNYTVCVLFKKMPPDQAEYYRKNHGFDC